MPGIALCQAKFRTEVRNSYYIADDCRTATAIPEKAVSRRVKCASHLGADLVTRRVGAASSHCDQGLLPLAFLASTLTS